jgi:hypothetical protein
LGFADFVSPEDGFRHCLHDRQKWARSEQPGIYFWLAEDGEAYVGQSIKPQSRLRQHWRDHGDIVRACFLPCAVEDLDGVEARLVERAGKHFPLRNIKLAVSTSRDVAFDEVVSTKERELFLAGKQLRDIRWRDLEHLSRVQEKRFARYLTRGNGPQGIVALQQFVSVAIPKPAATEVRFWSATVPGDGTH